MLLCGVFVSCFASVWNPEFSAQLDLDDRQGFIASSAMQQKKRLSMWMEKARSGRNLFGQDFAASKVAVKMICFSRNIY